jgi:hypothetical protein
MLSRSRTSEHSVQRHNEEFRKPQDVAYAAIRVCNSSGGSTTPNCSRSTSWSGGESTPTDWQHLRDCVGVSIVAAPTTAVIHRGMAPQHWRTYAEEPI